MRLRTRLGIYFAIGIAIFLFIATGTIALGASDLVWSMTGNDFWHTGRSSYTGGADVSLKWKEHMGSYNARHVVVGDNGIIFTQTGIKLRATNPQTGEVEWEASPPVSGFSSPRPSGMAIGSNGWIYYSAYYSFTYSYGAFVAAVDQNGRLQWYQTFDYASSAMRPPVIAPDGTVIVIQGRIAKAFDPLQGSEKWSYMFQNYPWEPVIDGDTAYFSVPYYQGSKVIALDTATGAVKWVAEIPDVRYYTRNFRGLVMNPETGTLYLAAHSKSADVTLLIAIDNANGSELWRTELPASNVSVGSSYVANDLYFKPAVGQDGTIYLGLITNGKLYAINPDGSIKWEFQTHTELVSQDPKGIVSIPTIDANGTVYIAARDGMLYALNPGGTQKWSFALGGSAYDTQPVLGANGDIYLVVDGSYLTAIQTKSEAVESLSVNPTAVTVEVCQNQQLTVLANKSNGSSEDVTAASVYVSNDPSIATVSDSGLITGVAPGTTTVTVNYNNVSATVEVTIVEPQITNISVLPGEVTVEAGSSQQLDVTAHYSDGSSQDITGEASYSSSNSKASVDNNGLVTGVAEGAASISVTYEGQTVTVPVTVTAPAVESLTVSPSSISIPSGRTQHLTVIAHLSDGSTQDVTNTASYSTSNNQIAEISAGGIITGISKGAATVSAGYQGKTAIASLTVTDPELQSISVSPEQLNLETGATGQLTVIAHLSDGSTQDVTNQAGYDSSNSSKAAVNNSGLVSGVAEGTASISVTYEGQTVTVPVTVIDPEPETTLTGISVQPYSITLIEGNAKNLKVFADYSDGTSEEITGLAAVTYNSEDNSVAAVTVMGQVTANKEGKTTITVSYEGLSAEITVTVQKLTVTRSSRGTGGTIPPIAVPPSRGGNTSNPPATTTPSRDTGEQTPVAPPDRGDAGSGSSDIEVSGPGGNRNGFSGSQVILPSERDDNNNSTIVNQKTRYFLRSRQ